MSMRPKIDRVFGKAREIAGPGSFKGFADAAPGADIVKGLRG